MNVKKRNQAGYIACICGLLYALPHFWWGLGVSFGFPGDFAKVPDELLSRVIGYWFMGVMAVLAALFSLSFVYKWGEKLPRRLKLIPAWIGCIGLSIWGTSIGLTEGLRAARMELMSLLDQFELFSKQVETTMNTVMDILSDIPGTAQMLNVPGVGAVTVAGFLAEVGDLSSYDHGQQIIRLAGLNLKENSSGKRKGKTGITKRGRSRLRALLFRCVMPMVAKNEEFKALHKYFTTRSQNPLKKKQSLIALCGKLIRVLHTLGTNQREYNANEVLGPARQAQLQQIAA